MHKYCEVHTDCDAQWQRLDLEAGYPWLVMVDMLQRPIQRCLYIPSMTRLMIQQHPCLDHQRMEIPTHQEDCDHFLQHQKLYQSCYPKNIFHLVSIIFNFFVSILIWYFLSLSGWEAYLSLGVVSSSLNICTVSVLDEQARNSPQGEKDRLYIVAVRFNPLRNS